MGSLSTWMARSWRQVCQCCWHSWESFWLWAGVDTFFITFRLMVATIVTLSIL